VTGRTRRLLIFVKYPKPGVVKTRLAASLGGFQASALYRNFVLDVLDTVRAAGAPFTVCFDPPAAAGCIRQWLGEDLSFAPQRGGDLGERMRNAFEDAFAAGADDVVTIGSDVPDLPAGVLNDAFRSLEGHDAVLGPAKDGGYYLIGFTRNAFLAEAFQGIAWSTGTVAGRTLDILRRHDRQVGLLPVLADVDTIDDLRRFFTLGQDAARRAPRTVRYLELRQDFNGLIT
jgi:rSAM/selenodomain-associated transferase 1